MRRAHDVLRYPTRTLPPASGIAGLGTMAQRTKTQSAEPYASLFTRPFVLLCIAMFLGYANQWLVTPVIPLYVDAHGGSAFLAGLALLALSVPSVAVRPFVGKLADRWSATGVLASGLVLLVLGSGLLLIPLFAMVFAGNFVRGLGWAGLNTGGYTALAGAAPPQRRGEAAGYYTSATSAASILFPALGLLLLEMPGSYQSVFVLSAAAALVGLPFTFALGRAQAETPIARTTPTAKQVPATLLDRGVLISTALNLCSTLAMPSVMAFLPLYARSIGVANIGLFYVIAGITNIVVRPLLGKWSDDMGRGPAIAVGLAAQFIGLLFIVLADGLSLILGGAVFVALGSAMTSSTTTALAMDLANPSSRGQAMATYSISFQLGAGLGAIISGALADLVGLRGMYVGSLAITCIGLLLLASAWKLLPRPEDPRGTG
ncbi:MAG: MFS transporter [Betaproteobacteria bacterium]|nr:MAG: MFS transporter [Betaproteobacteria bacterium]